MTDSETAWQDWLSRDDNDWHNDPVTKDAFMTGFRFGAQAQWDASVREAFAARIEAQQRNQYSAHRTDDNFRNQGLKDAAEIVRKDTP